MTPEQEAINLLDRAVSALTVDRQTHAKLQQAVILLTKAIEPKKVKK